MITSKLFEARENTDDQVTIFFSFVSDWLRGWHDFFGQITRKSYDEPRQSRVTSNTQMKTAPTQSSTACSHFRPLHLKLCFLECSMNSVKLKTYITFFS